MEYYSNLINYRSNIIIVMMECKEFTLSINFFQ